MVWAHNTIRNPLCVGDGSNMRAAQTVPVQEFETLPFAWSWRDVLRAAALGELLLLWLTIVQLRDLLAAALAIILLVGLALFLLRGKLFGFVFQMIARVIMWRIPEERVGALILGFLFADIGFYTVTGAASNVLSGATGAAILLPASLATFAVLGLVAAVMCVFQERDSYIPNRAAVNFVTSVLLVSSIVMGIGLLRGNAAAARVLPPSDVKLVTENMGYSQTALKAQAGMVRVELDNHDLFWHTFTIEQLGVNMQVPMQATQQIAFEAAPGVYTFHCAIPGHEMLGMAGTLTVK